MRIGSLQQDSTIMDLLRQQNSQEQQNAVQNSQSGNPTSAAEQLQQDSQKDQARLTVDAGDSAGNKHSRQMLDIMA
jgi:hypothetical protein